MALIALIIAIHGVLGYVGFDQFWSYADVQEVTLAPVTEVILFAAIGPFALFMIALLFLVAGLLARPSLERKGPGRFAADRLLRLGVPFIVFTFGLWPLLMYALYHPLGAAPGSYWDEFVDENGHPRYRSSLVRGGAVVLFTCVFRLGRSWPADRCVGAQNYTTRTASGRRGRWL